MTTRNGIETALLGKTPDKTKLTFYSWMANDLFSDEWKKLYDLGLGICHHCRVVKEIEHGTEFKTKEVLENGNIYTYVTKKTPIGSVRLVKKNGWVVEHWIKTPQDYKIWTWISQNTELVPDYDSFERAEELVGNLGVAVILASRTPLMQINVDLCGTELFCLDLALDCQELLELYEARKKLFIAETNLIAKGPGQFINWLENLTVSMIGPTHYSNYLMPMYRQCVPTLEKTGKRVMVHYDGALKAISDQIAAAPFHMIESLTEPPEGDMMYSDCRAAWPDKVFWANINVACYDLPEEQLAEQVIQKRQRAGKKGLVFAISEELPKNWRTSIPIVLKTLNDLP